ncbi:MptD family putative ECF transporter S component [Carnobacterium mobile]|uniref:MptD family putative ECF transporter S component n=1 Tax=Carnobacterium mobile TaxID=2750 RepID=UPI0005507928|nr:MptD family putative ECF transporter S component [Carnobacterium mobile]
MEKLKVGDLINIGVFSALYFVCLSVGTLLGVVLIPGGTHIFAPSFAALLSGVVYMFLVTKVKKFGAISIVGILLALFYFSSGHFGPTFLASLVFGFLADFVAKKGNYASDKWNLVSYFVFSLGNLGPILPMWFMKEAYIQSLVERGKDSGYITNVLASFEWPVIAAVLVSLVLFSIIGGVFGQKMVEKHFSKAGLV